MNKRVLRLPDVKNATGLSRSSIYQMMSEGSFPRNISLGKHAVGWLENEISDWINSRIRKARPSMIDQNNG